MKSLVLATILAAITSVASAGETSVNCPLYSQTVFTAVSAKRAGFNESDTRLQALMAMPISWSSQTTRSDAVDVVLAVEEAFASKETNPAIAAQNALARCTQSRQSK